MNQKIKIVDSGIWVMTFVMVWGSILVAGSLNGIKNSIDNLEHSYTMVCSTDK